MSRPCLVQFPLQLIQLLLLRLHYLGQLGDLRLSLPLVLRELRLHLNCVFGGLEELIVCLAEDSLHLFDVATHATVLIFEGGEVVHALH